MILERALLTKGYPRVIRALKPLRWFKLARLVKLGKADQIMDAFTDYFTISPRASKTVKVRRGERGGGWGIGGRREAQGERKRRRSVFGQARSTTPPYLGPLC